MLLLKNLLFTIMVPGTVAVVLPLWIAGRPVPAPTPTPGSIAGVLLLVCAGMGYFWCLYEFAVTGRGTPAPVDPPKHLVVRGPYRVVRNPMYVSVALAVFGWAAYLHSTRLLAYGLVVGLCFHSFVVVVEEPTLQRKFGDAYAQYRRTVRRWIPTRPT